MNVNGGSAIPTTWRLLAAWLLAGERRPVTRMNLLAMLGTGVFWLFVAGAMSVTTVRAAEPAPKPGATPTNAGVRGVRSRDADRMAGNTPWK